MVFLSVHPQAQSGGCGTMRISKPSRSRVQTAGVSSSSHEHDAARGAQHFSVRLMITHISSRIVCPQLPSIGISCVVGTWMGSP